MNYELNYELTLNENAQNLYKKYHKQKRSLTFILDQISKIEEKITYYNEVKSSLPYLTNSDIEDLKNELQETGLLKKKKIRKNKNPSYEVIDTNNALFFVGKSSIQNDYLYTKIAKKDDYWFHLKDYPGPHVFLRGELNTINIEKAASLAIKYSKLKNEPSALVNYTQVKNTKKLSTTVGFKLSLTKYQTINYKVNNTI